MPNKPENHYRAWLVKAGEDELSARVLIEKEAGAPSTICFLSQQMAEKYLKGLLVFHNEEFLKIHDLIELETLLLGVEPEIQSFHEDCKTLNQYYVGTRYPADVPEFTFQECKYALEAAFRIKEFVIRKIEEQENATKQKGFTSIILVIIMVALAGAVGYFYSSKNQKGFTGNKQVTIPSFTDYEQPLSEDIINCEFKAISHFFI